MGKIIVHIGVIHMSRLHNLRNTYKVIIIIFLVIAGYIMGFHAGEKAVINEQIIYNETMSEGNYFAEYHGEIHWYYYD